MAVRKDSPLIAGVGEDEAFIASDIPALLKYTRDVYYLDNGEVVHILDGDIKIYDEERNLVDKTLNHIDWDTKAAEKGGYSCFMEKEIFEQPEGIKLTLERRLNEDGNIVLDDIKLDREYLESVKNIYIVACGTAYHAGVLGKTAMQKFMGIPVTTDIASEFRYNDNFVDEHSLVILVSQSGETADTLAVLRDSKKKGARILAVTNVVGSSIAREADDVFYTWAGPEIAVASTDHPVRQGMWGVFEVFMDTIVICSMTALVVLVSGVWDSGLQGAALTTAAFQQGFTGGQYIVSVGLTLFAFTTILGWSYYGEKCTEYLLGKKAVMAYRILYIPLVLVGSIGGLQTIWAISDTLNGLMALPNLIALVLMSKVVVNLVQDFFKDPERIRTSEEEYLVAVPKKYQPK